MTTIEKIRVEIERRKNNAETLRERNICIDILFFLDSLEAEKPINQNELEEEIQSFWNRASGFQPKFVTLEVKENGFATIARHFAQWGADHTSLPEDTVLFNKGVEEGKRLMMEDAVEIGTTDIYWEIDGDRAFPAFDPPVEDLLMPGIISQKFNDGDKVRIIILPKED